MWDLNYKLHRHEKHLDTNVGNSFCDIPSYKDTQKSELEDRLIFIEDGYNVQEKAENFTILTSGFQNDGINFFATYYWPHKPKALVFISHGYGEYLSDSYDELCRELASKGILAFGHDHTGHGRTGGYGVSRCN